MPSDLRHGPTDFQRRFACQISSLGYSQRGECRPERRKKRSQIVTRQPWSPRLLSTSDPSAAACSAHTRLKTLVARRIGKSSVSRKQLPPDRNRFGSLAHIHAITRPPPEVIRFSCVCECNLTYAYVVHNANGLYRRTRTYAAWIQHACASRDHSDQRGTVSRRFPKKSFRTPLPPRSKMGGYGRASRKTYFRKSRRQLHPAVSDPPRSQIRARSASPLPK
jgi:hypothetical protein